MAYQQIRQASLSLVEQRSELLQSYKLWQAEQKAVENFRVTWYKNLTKQDKLKQQQVTKRAKLVKAKKKQQKIEPAIELAVMSEVESDATEAVAI